MIKKENKPCGNRFRLSLLWSDHQPRRYRRRRGVVYILEKGDTCLIVSSGRIMTDNSPQFSTDVSYLKMTSNRSMDPQQRSGRSNPIRYTISQLARAASVPTTTLRYYERIGLLVPEDRSSANYRLYSETSLRKVRWIRAAQSVGFRLEDLKVVLGDQASRPRCCDVQPLLEARLQDIERKLQALQQLKRSLRSLLQQCQQAAPQSSCPIIEELKRT